MRAYEVHLREHITYPITIVFDRDSLYISDHFRACAASMGILLEPSPADHKETGGQIEILNKEVVTTVRVCELEVDKQVKKLHKIQLWHNSRNNVYRISCPFHMLYGFIPRYGPLKVTYSTQ